LNGIEDLLESRILIRKVTILFQLAKLNNRVEFAHWSL